MKNIIKLIVLLGIFVASACETEIVERVDEFSLESGGYMRTISPYPVVAASTFKVSRANMAGTKWEIVAEAVTPNLGANFESYDLIVRFVDATAANGTNSVSDVPLKSFSSTIYTKDAVTGYPRATLAVTGKEMQDALKIGDAQISTGDRFEIRATMRLKDGKSFNADNSDPDISGGAFYSSPFFYRVNIVD
ncbi:MAG: hypothetical protein HC892_20590 [Saprospiraceae bacterium]|nr:hypothetical protein [Saprospiraceae bacterium]